MMDRSALRQAYRPDENRVVDQRLAEAALSSVEEKESAAIARSLSKSSLAGIHVGFAAAHPDAVTRIERMFTAPYHLDALQLSSHFAYAQWLDDRFCGTAISESASGEQLDVTIRA